MKKYKVRITGLGIEATAIIPFEIEPTIEPTIEQVENKIAEYLNHNLMKIDKDDFYSVDRYSITYEELPIEL
jgi:hypothetical protein